MTKEEWVQVEKALSGLYGHAKLKIGGYDITLQRSLIKKNQLGVVVFVNGQWKGEWVGKENDCPEQTFLCPRDRYVYTAKSRAEQKKLIKRYGKRRSDSLFGVGDPDKKIRIFLPWFPSGKAARLYYQKKFVGIELIEVVGC